MEATTGNRANLDRVASRIVRVSGSGRMIVETTTEELATPRGTRFYVVGNMLGDRIDWLERKTGRPPSPEERLQVRLPSTVTDSFKNAPEPETPAELLGQAEAIRAAYVEQRKTPIDLLTERFG